MASEKIEWEWVTKYPQNFKPVKAMLTKKERKATFFFSILFLKTLLLTLSLSWLSPLAV